MKLLFSAFIAVFCFLLDQISKSWAQQNLSTIVYKPLLPGLLRLVLVTNTGGAFGIAGGNNYALALLSAAIMIGILSWALLRQKSGHHLGMVQWCGIGFLVGGAFGNLWNRIMLGHVIDFLDFAFINFPVFNLSDVFVDVGIGLVVLGFVFKQNS
jgi:signal peptidase II